MANFLAFRFLLLIVILHPVVLCVQLILSTTPASQSKMPHKVEFELPKDYNKNKHPGVSGKVVHVEFEIHVQAINPIKASDMDFRMELMLVLRWVDPRLIFPDHYFDDDVDRFVLPSQFIDSIWHPDPYFSNAKSTDVGQLTQRLVNIYIYQNQTVTYSVNLFATIACAMNFRYFPFDFQLCPTVIESFSYDEKLVKYFWSSNHAFTINPKLRLLQFVVTYPLRYEECSIHRISESRNFSQLIAYFRFDRLLGNHLIQTFAPCSLIVSLTWFSFWLELDAVSARVSLLVTAMLTLVTQFSGLKVDFPPVAYLKAVDLWMAMCLTFVFAALGEFVIVKVIYSLTEDAKATVAMSNSNGNAELQAKAGPSPNPLPTPSGLSPTLKHRSKTRSNSLMDEMDTMDDDGNGQPKTTTFISVYTRQGLSSAPKKLAHRISEMEIPDLTYSLSRRIRFSLVWTVVKTGKKHVLWRDIDYLCRWLFPLTFCLCLCVYWTILFIHSLLNSPEHKPPSYCT